MTQIPANFKIPKRYHRTFQLHVGGGLLRISVSGKDGIRIGEAGNIKREHFSATLDWIQESIEKVRIDCGA